MNLNQRSADVARACAERCEVLRISSRLVSGARILDFGVDARGGLEAGLQLAKICMADLGEVQIQAPGPSINVPQLVVRTDHPLAACLQSQYAGWKIATADFYAMGSGPIRATIATEDLFTEFPVNEVGNVGVAVLESGTLPTKTAMDNIRAEVGSNCELIIAVAPTASQAGNLQVVARSVETAMHKLHELRFPVQSVVSAAGTAPLPPVARNDLEGIGRTNDSILYGSTVSLWVDCDDAVIEQLGSQTPSNSSDSHGERFLNLFEKANHDFYALDKALFSPAVVVFHSLKTGKSFQYGILLPDLLHESFGM